MIAEFIASGFLVLHGPSWHSTDNPKGQPYEWATFGAGWRMQRDGWGMQAGAYRNSYGLLSLYGGVAVGREVGVFGGLASGYVKRQAVPMFGAYANVKQLTFRVMPIVRVQGSSHKLEGAVITTEYAFK